MSINIHKVLGYGTRDMVDLGITSDQVRGAEDRDYITFVTFVEDWIDENITKENVSTEYLGAILHRFDAIIGKNQNPFAADVDWRNYDYGKSQLYQFMHFNDEGGDPNAIVFAPRADMYRRDDDIDWEEWHVRYGHVGDYEPRIENVITPINPWRYMMKRDPSAEPWGIETYFAPPCYLDIPGEVYQHIPYVPYNIKLMMDFITGRDMIDEYLKLRPMIYTYWC